MTNDDLRKLYQEGSVASDRSGCPPADRLQRAAARRLDEGERDALIDHLGRCSDCAEELRLALELEPNRQSTGPALRASPTVPATFWLGGLAVAAALVLAFGALLRPGAVDNVRPSPAVRGTGSPTNRLQAAAPRGDFAGSPTAFEWGAWPGAESYRVQLFSEDGTPQWTSGEVAPTRLDWPTALALPPGRYFWKVEALHRGEVVAESPLTRFTFAP